MPRSEKSHLFNSILLTIVWLSALTGTGRPNFDAISLVKVLIGAILIHCPFVGYHFVDVDNFTSDMAKLFWESGRILYVVLIINEGGMLRCSPIVPLVMIGFSACMMHYQRYLKYS